MPRPTPSNPGNTTPYPGLYSHLAPPSLCHACTQRCQAALTQDGALRLAAVGPAVRALLPRIALRDGWKEAMQVGVWEAR